MRTSTRTFASTITGLLLLSAALTSTTAWADRDHNRGRGWGHRGHDHDRSNVSVNVNVGRPYYSPRYNDYRPSSVWSYGVGFGTFGSGVFIGNSWGNPYSGWNSGWNTYDRYYDRRPVIVEKNIYIEQATPEHRVTTRSINTTTTSLFRDRYGRCYERERDSFGNETRIEIDASECDF